MKFPRLASWPIYTCTFILAIVTAGCASIAPPVVIPTPTENYSAVLPTSAAEDLAESTASPTPAPSRSIFIPPYFPAAFLEKPVLPSGWKESESPDRAGWQLKIGRPTDDDAISAWVYAAAARFPTIEDRVSSRDLRSAWSGKKPAGTFPSCILASPDTAEIFSIMWGRPDPSTVKILPEKDLLSEAWKDGAAVALIPFEGIQPKWKILDVDGLNPLHKKFDPARYPLTVPIVLSKTSDAEPGDGADLNGVFPPSNRDPSKLTTVVLTGVTALVRGTADLMERNGMDYPAGDIGSILREADLTQISNEIPFTPRCPPPFMREDNLVFCSKPEYIQLLETVGADVIELSGDHFKDWGRDAVETTIRMYIDRGWKYYGGGFNLEDGQKALQIEVNGNRIAFIGCNGKDKGYAGATATLPGAVSCDFEWLKKEIGRVKAEGYLPIVTFQHQEFDSIYPTGRMQTDFQQVSFDGAAIVSGSQAHQPMAMEFFRGSFLHFGLGNLFFDQYKESLAKRQAFIDRHIVYDNRFINTELITIQFVDLARPRLMTEAERRDLLTAVFAASGWK